MAKAKTWIELYQNIFKTNSIEEITISPKWQDTIKLSFAPKMRVNTLKIDSIQCNNGATIIPIETSVKEPIMREIYLWLELFLLSIKYKSK